MRFRFAVLLLPLALVLPAGSVSADTDDARLEPVAAGPPVQVSRELAYAGFPSVVRLPSGAGYLIAYGVSTSHFGPAGRIKTRRSVDGVVWAGESQVPGQTDGYSWGAGLAAETTAQGGRIYLNMVREAWYPNSQTVSSVAGFLRYSDDDGQTWDDLPPYPGSGPVTGAGAFWFFPNDLKVLADGTLFASGYSWDRHARYLVSDDRGQTWTQAGNLTPPAGRKFEEPTLCELPDGRILSVIRSDEAGAGGSQWLYATTRSTTGTWSAPYVITFDGSGRPDITLINSESVMVLYRGWIDRADPDLRPMRVQMMGRDPATGVWKGYRGNVDLTPGMYGRWLYGGVVPAVGDGANRWRVVFGYEGPNGATAAAGQILSLPLEFRAIP